MLLDKKAMEQIGNSPAKVFRKALETLAQAASENGATYGQMTLGYEAGETGAKFVPEIVLRVRQPKDDEE